MTDRKVGEKLEQAFKEMRDRLAQPEPELKSCRHCGFQYRQPKDDKWHPLSQPKPEPVAYVNGYYGGHCVVKPIDTSRLFNSGTPLYTAPPKREWVWLTDEEIDAAVKSCNTVDTCKYFRAIESKLKEKNNG